MATLVLLRWLTGTKYDVVCLQELKSRARPTRVNLDRTERRNIRARRSGFSPAGVRLTAQRAQSSPETQESERGGPRRGTGRRFPEQGISKAELWHALSKPHPKGCIQTTLARAIHSLLGAVSLKAPPAKARRPSGLLCVKSRGASHIFQHLPPAVTRRWCGGNPYWVNRN